MKETINYEDLFDWEIESDRHYLFLLERHKEEQYDWEQSEQKERNKRLPAIIQVLIPTKETYETKYQSLAF